MIVSKKTLSRRTMLRGVGATLALVTVRSGGQAPVQSLYAGSRRRPCCARRRDKRVSMEGGKRQP